jgi:hypothetical protein
MPPDHYGPSQKLAWVQGHQAARADLATARAENDFLRESASSAEQALADVKDDLAAARTQLAAVEALCENAEKEQRRSGFVAAVRAADLRGILTDFPQDPS